MPQRSFLSSGKKDGNFSLPLGIADTKRFFHHGLLRSDFSSSLSFLSSTCGGKKGDTDEAPKPQMNSVMLCVNINESNQPNVYLSFEGVLAGWRGWSEGKGTSSFSLFNRNPPVEARVTCGPSAWADNVRAAAADEPVWEWVALLVVFQISLGQVVRHVEGVADVLPQHASFRDGRIRWRMSRSGVVHFRPHYCSSWGALEEFRIKMLYWWNSSKYSLISFNIIKCSSDHGFPFFFFFLYVGKHHFWKSKIPQNWWKGSKESFLGGRWVQGIGWPPVSRVHPFLKSFQ